MFYNKRLDNIEFELDCVNKKLDSLNSVCKDIKRKLDYDILATEKFRKEYKEAIATIGSLRKAFAEQKDNPCHGAHAETPQQ